MSIFKILKFVRILRKSKFRTRYIKYGDEYSLEFVLQDEDDVKFVQEFLREDF